ncbi:hypothetical protein XBFFL1_310111 [Xenorhabdus bovienii str. feltiae Florida]|nr:hypothetical protein XBFFR1_1840112 [Xenorhabdus bovienii str. feltiae France]CDG94127.1 hypothetical protein XBFFL1_310111 [Xenorhabdus bovienii str. feltiae Florida]
MDERDSENQQALTLAALDESDNAS